VCQTNKDCASGGCSENRCDPHGWCHNGIKDKDETDIDCGGAKCLRCEKCRGCLIDGDCMSGNCVKGKCGMPSCFCTYGGFGKACIKDECVCDARSCLGCCNGSYGGSAQCLGSSEKNCGHHGSLCIGGLGWHYGCQVGQCTAICSMLAGGWQTGCCAGPDQWSSGKLNAACGKGLDKCVVCPVGTNCVDGVCK
jgi:hypothetical protein